MPPYTGRLLGICTWQEKKVMSHTTSRQKYRSKWGWNKGSSEDKRFGSSSSYVVRVTEGQRAWSRCGAREGRELGLSQQFVVFPSDSTAQCWVSQPPWGQQWKSSKNVSPLLCISLRISLHINFKCMVYLKIISEAEMPSWILCFPYLSSQSLDMQAFLCVVVNSIT